MTSSFAQHLNRIITGDVEESVRRRAEYSTDASNYRVVPSLVAFPRTAEDILAARSAAADEGMPLTLRGGGTSIAGNSIGPGLVLDLSRYYNKILDLDVEARRARVQPGVVLSTLQELSAPHGLRFGPDPSTSTRATIGGMIGNNACGPHAVAWGKTAENVLSLDVVDGKGHRFTAGQGANQYSQLDAWVDRNLGLIRPHFGRFSRQVSGYSLEHLLPENGRDLAKFLVGSEGSLATVLEADLRLVPFSPDPYLVVIGYDDMIAAADAVPGILDARPLAVEGLDRRLVDMVARAKGKVPDLPEGNGWLLVEVGAYEGEDPSIVDDRINQIHATCQSTNVIVEPAGPAAKALWHIRADGAGLGGRTPRDGEAWPGWEDSAVPPEKLGDYLRDMSVVMDKHDVDGILYGHFGDGCVHVRYDFPLHTPGDIPATRAFIEDAAQVVVSYGGSLSGEHGDGRARSELLETMYGPEIVDVFGQVKTMFDPDNTLNPGIIVDPVPFDADLRRPHAQQIMGQGFNFTEDGGDFTRALHRCTGVGNCRADRRGSGFYMCPSYQATRDEKDVTRGRVRVLEEVANGQLIADWGSSEVMESLDLCLSCKACSVDCPTGVDMARYKSEVLHRAYQGKVRPKLHYLLGRLPTWTGLATKIPAVARLANAAMSLTPVRKGLFRLAGIDPERPMPPLATTRFSSWLAGQPRSSGKKPVLLWADSFSETLDTRGAQDLVALLEANGYSVIVPPEQACCGLTWITTGQLDTAKKKLRELLRILGPIAVNNIPIVGLEPSCTAVLRSDLVDLLPEDPRAHAVASATHTLAELITSDPDFQLPDLSGTTVVAQPHCHHYSVMGWDADRRILERTGAHVVELSGCCGMAGNFGMEADHHDISVKIASGQLLPGLDNHPDAVFLADGFSCRTQAESLASRGGVHLSSLLRKRPVR